MRSFNVSRRLTLADAVRIWQQRWAGTAQHILAAEYQVNPGRIAEVLAGKRFPEARRFAERDSRLVPDEGETDRELLLPLDEHRADRSTGE